MKNIVHVQFDDPDNLFKFPIKNPDILAGDFCKTIRTCFGIKNKCHASVYSTIIPDSDPLSSWILDTDVIEIVDENGIPQKPSNSALKKFIPPGKFLLLSTVNYYSFTEGDLIDLSIESDIDHARSAIYDFLHGKYKINQNVEIIIYLAGGCLFEDGLISDYYESFDEAKRYIYAVVTRKAPFCSNESSFMNFLRRPATVCCIKSEEDKFSLSPYFQSSPENLYIAASIYGYLCNNGQGTEQLFNWASNSLLFAPFSSHLHLLINKYPLQRHEEICITSSLMLLIQEMSKENKDSSPVSENQIWAFGPKALAAIEDLYFETPSDFLITTRPFISDGSEGYFYLHCPTQETICLLYSHIYNVDTLTSNFELPRRAKCETSYNICESFKIKLIGDLEKRTIPCLFQGPNGISLFISKTSGKATELSGKYDVIFPENGELEHIDLDKKAKETAEKIAKQQNIKLDDVIIQDKKEVEQLVFVSIDESGSMDSRFEGNIVRFRACQELLGSFAAQAKRCHISTKYGLNTFETQVHHRLDLADLVSSFETALDTIRPNGWTAMFRGILEAANRLIAVESQYPKAIKRVIVMTDGDDNHDTPDLNQMFQRLIAHHIIVDAIIISQSVEWKLVSLAKMTGGIAVQASTLSIGLRIFERQAFYDPNIRLLPEPRFNRSLIGSSNYSLDFDIQSVAIPRVGKVYAPKAAAKQYEHATGDSKRTKEILKQIRIAAANPDPTIHILINQTKLDEWFAYIQSPADSNYGLKWWEISIKFPESYPSIAPIFRFTSPPYHPNITSDGMICLNLLNQDYSPEIKVFELLNAIQGLLLLPEYLSPVDNERLELYKYYNRAPSPQRDAEIQQVFNSQIKPKINESLNANKLDQNLSVLPQDWRDAISNDPSIFIDLNIYVLPPPEFKDPFTHKLMENPVRATTGNYFEKTVLEQKLSQVGVLYDPNNHQIIKRAENRNLPVDPILKGRIAEWKRNHRN